MKASPRQQLLLLELQEFDTRAARLRKQRASVPERDEFAALDEQYAEAKTRFMDAQRELDSHQAELERIESDVQLVEERRTRDNLLLTTNVSSRDAQALQKELDVLNRRQHELEDRELERMQSVETAQAKLDEAKSVLDALSAARAGLRERVTAAEAAIDQDLARNQHERELLAAELQRDVLDLYEQTRARTGLGAARLRGNVSEGSNMTLAPGDLAAIRASAADEIVLCPDSGAILVRVEEPDQVAADA